MKSIVVFLLISTTLFAQKDSAWVSGRYDLRSKWVDSTVTIEFGGFVTRANMVYFYRNFAKVNPEFNLEMKTIKLDSNGEFKLKVPLSSSGLVYVRNNGLVADAYLQPNDSIKIEHVYAPYYDLNDGFKRNATIYKSSIICTACKPQYSGKAAKINHFLTQINILGDGDSLQYKPLFKNSQEHYFKFLDELTADYWYQYQTTQDATNDAQNSYVWASIQGQNYSRKRAFFVDKNRNATQEEAISFKIINDDDAIKSGFYRSALEDWLGVNTVSADSTIFLESYRTLQQAVSYLPKTAALVTGKKLLTWIGVLPNDTNGEGWISLARQLVRAYDESYPKHVMTPAIKRTLKWYELTRPLKEGSRFPDLKFLRTNQDTVLLGSPTGKYSVILLWNTWCDSCKTSFEDFLSVAKDSKNPKLNWVTLSINNRFETWNEFVANYNVPYATHLYTQRDDVNTFAEIMAARNDFPQQAMLLLLDPNGKVKNLPDNVSMDEIADYIK